MKCFLFIALIPGILSTIPAEAFWGLSEREEYICRNRASKQRNEFSAKQTYEYCKKNIKKELKEEATSKKQWKREAKNFSKYCKSLERKIDRNDSQYDSSIKGKSLMKGLIEDCWEEHENFLNGDILSLPNMGSY